MQIVRFCFFWCPCIIVAHVKYEYSNHLTAGNSHQHEKPIEEKELERAKRSGSREQPDSLMLEPIKMEIIIIDMD